MRVLVTGSKGQLGRQLHSILNRKTSDLGKLDARLASAEFKFVDHKELDVTSLNSVNTFMNSFKPDVVINCAAYTNVDGCEKDKDAAFKVNSIGPRNLSLACEASGVKLLHVSTDYVFPGTSSLPLSEFDIPASVSIYGKTKLLGEQYVREFCSRYFIVRTAWLYGEWGKNFVYTIMKAAKEKGHLEVVNDQRGNPTYAEDLAHHILKLILTEEYGIYHCTGSGECSWYDFACKIVEYSGINAVVAPITSDKLQRAAKRPAFSSLDNMMLRCTIGDDMRPWEEALKSFMNSINSPRR